MFIRPCYRKSKGKRQAYWALVKSSALRQAFCERQTEGQERYPQGFSGPGSPRGAGALFGGRPRPIARPVVLLTFRRTPCPSERGSGVEGVGVAKPMPACRRISRFIFPPIFSATRCFARPPRNMAFNTRWNWPAILPAAIFGVMSNLPKRKKKPPLRSFFEFWMFHRFFCLVDGGSRTFSCFSRFPEFPYFLLRWRNAR